VITLGALFGQFKGVFGKPYLLAGVVPAAFFTLSWLYLMAGWTAALARVAAASKNTAADTISAGLTILLLGVVFFASRAVLLRITQTLPGTVLTPLRNAWVRRRLQERATTVAAKQQVLHELTAIRWYKLGFVKPTYIPKGLEVDEAAAVIMKRSGDAREAIMQVRRRGNNATPTEAQARQIAGGLAALYSEAATRNAAGTEAEIQTWRDLMGEEESVAVVERAAESLHRTYGDRIAAEQAMPDVVSVKPTALGNCFASMEDYSYRRYRMDTTTMFNRVWGVLGKDQRSEIADTQLTVEVLVNLSWCATLLGIGTLTAYVVAGLFLGPAVWLGQWAVFAQTAGFIASAVLFYHGALFAAVELQSRVIRTIDLNRLAMIKKLGYAVPATVAEELMLFQELQGFFLQTNPRDSARKLKA
jgi:hypothetical protein